MRANTFDIGDQSVGRNCQCYIIGEAGVAHFGNLNKALSLVDLALEAQADAVKFQIFDVDRMISKEAQDWKDRLGGRSLSFQDFVDVKQYCDDKRITFLATPHDEYGVESLEKLDVVAYKIGSGEFRNWPFIEKIAEIGKPIILSTGMYSLQDVVEVVELFAKKGNQEVALLHCLTNYPAHPQEINLKVIDLFRDEFGGVVGYSDHTEGIHIPLAAVALGADIIEKHISLDFDIPNAQDWKVSCGPHNFRAFVENVREIEIALGRPKKCVNDRERASRAWACKSLVLAHDHKAGDDITVDSLLIKRPGTGILASDQDEVLGRKLKSDLAADSVIKWEHLE